MISLSFDDPNLCAVSNKTPITNGIQKKDVAHNHDQVANGGTLDSFSNTINICNINKADKFLFILILFMIYIQSNVDGFPGSFYEL